MSETTLTNDRPWLDLPKGVKFGVNWLKLPDYIDETGLGLVFRALDREQSGAQWRLGDFFLEVARVKPESCRDDEGRFTQSESHHLVKLMMEAGQVGRQQCFHCISVARFYTASNRLDTVSWTHHMVAMHEANALAEQNGGDALGIAMEWLRKAVADINEGVSCPVAKLRRLMRESAYNADWSRHDPNEEVLEPVFDYKFLMKPSMQLTKALRTLDISQLDQRTRDDLRDELVPFVELHQKLK